MGEGVGAPPQATDPAQAARAIVAREQCESRSMRGQYHILVAPMPQTRSSLVQPFAARPWPHLALS